MSRGFEILSMRNLFAGLALLVAAPVLAHHTTIEADAVCNTDGDLVINYVSTSWLTTGGSGSGNPQIDILFNGVKVDQGAYAAPSYSFSGSKPAPAGGSAIVTALAVGTWDSGSPGGQSASVTVTYPTEPCANEQPGVGRFTGGGFQLTEVGGAASSLIARAARTDGVRVTRGFTIHCDLLLSNNFEVNWNGNHFHMNEHLETLECSDDPLIEQRPPAAPLDTLRGVGTGRYNGVDGFTVEFTLVDSGEPGTSDEAAILIYETANPTNVVLNVPQQPMDGGNLQAHFDQPHKQ